MNFAHHAARRTVLGLAFAAALIGPALAQTASTQPIRIIVPYQAGGQTDVMARIIADSMRKTLQRNVIVENRTGAGGLIALQALKSAPADGDTVLLRDSAFVVAPMTMKLATYDPLTDLVPVAAVARSDMFLMVSKDVPARTVAEVIAYAKTVPNGIPIANNGINTGAHMAAALFAKKAGVTAVHVPFKGAAETVTALATGEVKMQINVTSDALNGQIKNGNVRLIATATSQASAFQPQLPRVKDTLPGFAFDGFFCILAAPGVPAERIEVLAKAVAIAVAEPGTRERFALIGVQPHFRGPQDLGQDITRQFNFYGDVVKELDIKPM